MGSFQITYDDFSGGQYMGSKSTNLPKNTWSGDNVISLSNGQLIPSGAATVSEIAQIDGTSLFTYIQDFFLVGQISYMFVSLDILATNKTRLISTPSVGDSLSTPKVSVVSSALPGKINGKVAYNPSDGVKPFYYIDNNLAGTIYSVSFLGATTAISSVFAGMNLTDMALYNYRLILWGGYSKRLYYSDTLLAGWSTSNYYEFTGIILNVIPRSNDLLVICETGVYSVVGVFGSSITIQLIVPQENVSEGMKDATVVNRNAYFLDQLRNGYVDGHVYRMVGSSTSSIATMNLTDVNESQATPGTIEAWRISSLKDGKLAVASKDGSVYVETDKNVWAKLRSETGPSSVVKFEGRQHCVARSGPNAFNEFFLVAYVAENTQEISILRFVHNVTKIVNKDEDFYGSTPSANAPSGVVTLSEYWHSKPFTVKEVFVEFYARLGYTPVLNVNIEPTGVIDLYSAENGSSYISGGAPLVVGINNTYNAPITQRFRPDNASKGMGVKPGLNFSNVTIKRVILNCED